MKYTVFEYLNLTPTEKYDYFMSTRSVLKFLASYWVNFDNVKKNLSLYDEPDLYTLDYLIGKSDEEVDKFFMERPELILLFPKLLGIRPKKLENGYLEIQDTDGVYKLNFEKIDKENLNLYLKFMHDSGLLWVLKSGLRKSVHDYAVGVEAGLDSNARKNRSGNMGEDYLEELLESIAKDKKWIAHGQTTAKTVKELYNLNLDETLQNRKFDGSLFNPKRKKLYLFEINNFNGGGSKIKASATEFKDLRDRFNRTNHEFIYITDGKGWDVEKSHLTEAMTFIGKVFNYKMVEDGYLDDYLE
ncbi:type II restriction endonuclease [Mammaliicoccus sciuri]|uniref:type II restriction endonuclease n=1 Tax=Mammaliicoccus sciuri TaxID=1296 RepID=UPI001E570EAA|nr:type II restriction endonuclease [Mammaliicoccus sciuri]MCD8845846.1 type II restriction endonuclease [Mammaliicoccus sciuri]